MKQTTVQTDVSFSRITVKTRIDLLALGLGIFDSDQIESPSRDIKSPNLYTWTRRSRFLSLSLSLLARAIGSVEISDRRNGNLIPPAGNIADVCLSDIRTYT